MATVSIYAPETEGLFPLTATGLPQAFMRDGEPDPPPVVVQVPGGDVSMTVGDDGYSMTVEDDGCTITLE